MGPAVFLLLFLGLYLLPAAALSVFAARWLGPFFSQFIAGLLWTLVLMLVYHPLSGWLHRRAQKYPHQHPNLMADVLSALDRIATGDFQVRIPTQEDAQWYGDSHFREFAQRVNRMAEELDSTERMRQEFVSNVSHEIQSPLTSIRGFAELLKREDLSSADRAHYLTVIEAESGRLSRLSDNLMRLTLLDTEHTPYYPAPFRLDKQLEQVLLSLEPQWSAKQIEPEADLPQTLLYADAQLLGQVWINLLQNAIKFTPEGGRVSVRLMRSEGEAVCTISDSGIGISEEALPHIFERFYKVDKSRDRSLGGNGLGLALVRKIVELHGGSIVVKSSPGQGSAFTVSLPDHQAEG